MNRSLFLQLNGWNICITHTMTGYRWAANRFSEDEKQFLMKQSNQSFKSNTSAFHDAEKELNRRNKDERE